MSIKISDYLNSTDIKKLHIGCGSNILEGWLNTDIHLFYPDISMYMDVTDPFPFENNTFNYIHTEHMLEHFKYTDGLTILKECFRVLKPGGKIRITLPDIDFLINIYNNKVSHRTFIMEQLKPWFDHQLSTEMHWENFILDDLINIDTIPNHFFNLYVRMDGHKFIYNKDTMTASMKCIGFKDITTHNICESNDVHLQNLEHINRWINHYGIIGRDQLQLESMTFEGTKL